MADAVKIDIQDDSLLYLMLAPPEMVNAMNISVIKNIITRGCTPLIITVNQPYKILAKTYSKEGIDPKIFLSLMP